MPQFGDKVLDLRFQLLYLSFGKPALVNYLEDSGVRDNLIVVRLIDNLERRQNACKAFLGFGILLEK